MDEQKNCATEYVVLSPLLDSSDSPRFAAYFDAFAAGYQQTFTGDLAESPQPWRSRILGESPAPQPLMRIVVAVKKVNDREVVIGGVAAEYYRSAECVLLTYLYVQKSERHRGHARTLIEKASAAFATIGNVRAVLAEAEWPDFLPAAGFDPSEVSEARQRLYFFSKIGARLVDIDYVQPALGNGMKPVSYLRLLLLPLPPAVGRGADLENTRIAISSFLSEFYAALAQSGGLSLDEPTLGRLQVQANARIPLLSVLPQLRLADFALCLHFVDHGQGAQADLPSLVAAFHCPIFDSMESDLLSRPYRAPRVNGQGRPFRSVCLTPLLPDAREAKGTEIEIEFPSRVTFHSENRIEDRFWTWRRRKARAHLSYTYFFGTGDVVWHLAITPLGKPESGAEGWFDDLDIIALVKLAEVDADQEQVRVSEDHVTNSVTIDKAILFRRTQDGTDSHCAPRFLRDLASHISHSNRLAAKNAKTVAPVPTSHVGAVNATTLQLLDWGWNSGDDTPVAIGSEMDADLVRGVVCGIVTGILDYPEIDEAEINDTLLASVKVDGQLIRAHRTTIVSVAEKDRSFRAVEGTIGISPYLIIPHAVALYNEAILSQPDEWSTAEERDRNTPSQRTSLDALEQEKVEREYVLRSAWLPDVFFYKTEKELYSRALIEKGIMSLRDRAEQELLDVKTRVQVKDDIHRRRFATLIAGLGAIITAFSMDSFFTGVLNWGHSVTAAFAVLFAMASLVLGWPRNSRVRRKKSR